MTRIILFFLCFLFTISSVYSQNELTENKKIYALGKVWGFLKYYHPNVAKGKFDWDENLLKILPAIEQVKSKKEFSNVLLNWINSLGKINVCKSCKQNNTLTYFNKNFNLSWTQDSTLFSKSLSEKLKFIETNRFQGEHHYVSIHKNAGNVTLQNEVGTTNFQWQNKHLRILALFKYWNSIEYFFPYKYLTDKNWDLVLQEMIPKFILPKSELDYHLAMLELVVYLDDSHAGLKSQLIDEYFGSKHIPVIFRIIENNAVIEKFFNDSLAKANDLEIGDKILSINNVSIKDNLINNAKYFRGSNESAKAAYAYDKIFNGSTDSIEVQFEREKILITKKIGRYPFSAFNYKRPILKKWEILDNSIGYVNLSAVDTHEVDDIIQHLKTTKSIIFDLRNYPKFTLPYFLNFLNASPKVYAHTIAPDTQYPGKFYWQKPEQIGEINSNNYKGRIIILVNSKTISYAEWYAMGLQTVNNSITIGSQTSGADGNVSRIEFIGGFKSHFSGLGVYYPDHSETQRKGVKIDIKVEQTSEGIKSGSDEILEKAIELANK